MKTTIDLPSDLALAVQARAAAEQQSVARIVESLLRLALHLPDPDVGMSPDIEESNVWERGESGSPIFRGRPDAPPTKLTIEELLALDEAALSEEEVRSAGITL